MEKTDSPGKDVPGYIEKIAVLLDNRFNLPGTKFRFGIDPLLGLIPGIGDLLSFMLGGIIVIQAANHKTSGKLLILMILNLIADTIIGNIPLLGDIFDFFYKANEKNVQMLRKYYSNGKYKGSGKGVVIMIVIIFAACIVLFIYGLWILLTKIDSLIG